MTRPRVYLASVWGVIALFTLYNGVAYRSAVAWWLLVALVPALIVFLWWMLDRAALERRIKRLEARSEIGDERRVVAHEDFANIEHKLSEIEARVARFEVNKTDPTRSELHQRQHYSSGSSAAGLISVNPK